MTEPGSSEADAEARGEAGLARLLRRAGPRPLPDPARTEVARAAVHAAWRESLARHRRARRQWLAVAAGVLALVGATIFAWRLGEPAPLLAHVAAHAGGAVRIDADGRRAPLVDGLELRAGERVETAAGAVAVRWQDGTELVVDAATTLDLASARRVRLAAGRVYVVVSERTTPRAAGLSVETVHGVVRHLGTRFEVQSDDARLRVRVRNGRVELDGPGAAPVRVAAGEELTVADGRLRLGAGPTPDDPAWDWTHALAGERPLEGRSLAEVLESLAADGGFELRYASAADRERARSVLLHGSLRDVAPREALGVVLGGSGFDWRIDGRVVTVERGAD